MASGTQTYEAFHGHGVRKRTSIKIPDLRQLVCLGDAVEIVYRSDKSNGGGDGKRAEYMHKFKAGAKLYCDASGNTVLLIHGPKIIVREPGIIN